MFCKLCNSEIVIEKSEPPYFLFNRLGKFLTVCEECHKVNYEIYRNLDVIVNKLMEEERKEAN
jgi:hypothetical protein